MFSERSKGIVGVGRYCFYQQPRVVNHCPFAPAHMFCTWTKSAVLLVSFSSGIDCYRVLFLGIRFVRVSVRSTFARKETNCFQITLSKAITFALADFCVKISHLKTISFNINLARARSTQLLPALFTVWPEIYTVSYCQGESFGYFFCKDPIFPLSS